MNNVFEITLRGIGEHIVEATGGTGGRVRMGPKGTPDSFTPVELLLAAIAGCAGIDLCRVSERDGVALGEFELRVRGAKPVGATPLSQITVTYSVPETTADAPEALVAEAGALCSVALTVAQGCPVEHTLARPRRAQ